MAVSLWTRMRAAIKIATGGYGESEIMGLLFPHLWRSPPARGTAELLTAYEEMPWLRVAQDKVSWSVASVRWRLLAVKPKGKEKYARVRILQRAGLIERKALIRSYGDAGELEEIAEHPLLNLLHSANSYFTGGVHRYLTETYLDLVGEAFWLYERDALGVIVAVWPVPPHWVRSTPTPTTPTYSVQVDRSSFEVPTTEMLWFCHPRPVNPFGRGTGLANALGDELETDEYAARHTKQWFFNSARPDLVVSMLGAEKGELLRAQQSWMEKHQGFWRAFKPHFSNREIKVQEIGHTFREMQLTELRQHERDTIIQVYGVPPEILGILQNSNRATIDAADFIMAKHVTIPRLEFLREIMQERLVPEYDERIILDYESPMEEDREFQLKAAQAQPGALTVDEWRTRFMGLEPLDDGRGEVFLTPTTVTATEDPGGGIGPFLPPLDLVPPDEGGDGEDGDGDEGDGQDGDQGDGNGKGHRRLLTAGRRELTDPELEEAFQRLAVGLEQQAQTATTCLVPVGIEQRLLVGVEKGAEEEFIATVHRIADRLTPRWRRAFLDVMERVKGRVSLERLEAALRTANPEAVASLLPADVVAAALGEGRLGALVRATVTAAGHAAAADLARSLGVTISFAELNPRSVAWIQQATGRLITEVTRETVLAVRAIIERSFREAIAPRDAARLIREVIGLHSRQASAVAGFRRRLVDQGVAASSIESRVARYAEAQLRYRALMIARTETIEAANMGQQILWQQAARSGLLKESEVRRIWLVTPDDRLDTRVCEPMPHLDANQDVKLDQPFTTGTGEKVTVPPAHPNCRCAVALRFTT